jgi:hypothetical protein
MAEMSMDRDALREVLTSLRPGAGENDWCVACGAGAASAKLDFPAELVDKAGQQFLDPSALRDFVSRVRDVGGEQAWCVACGAGAAASPLDKIGNPTSITDDQIDELSRRILGAVRLG